jgi:predicted small integral membrane protein
MEKKALFFAVCIFVCCALWAETEARLSAGPTYFFGLIDSETTRECTYGINAKGSAFFNSFPLGLYMNVSGFFASGALMLAVGPAYQFELSEMFKIFTGIGFNMSTPDYNYLAEHKIKFPHDTSWGINLCAALHIQFTESFFSELGVNAEFGFTGYVGPNARPFVALGFSKIIG